MCLAVPGKLLKIWESDGTRMATVDVSGVEKEACLAYLPDIQVGDYTIVHLGFALQHIDEETALKTLALFQQMGEIEAEFDDPRAKAAEASSWLETQARWTATS